MPPAGRASVTPAIKTLPSARVITEVPESWLLVPRSIRALPLVPKLVSRPPSALSRTTP